MLRFWESEISRAEVEDRSISIFVWRLGSVGDRPGFGVH
jgi:hypothetical protein